MKKQILFVILILSTFVSCKKDDPILNNFKGTSWTAPNDIAQLIYGGECTTTIEFLTDNTCQEIETIKGTSFFNKTTVTAETYTYKNDSVSWTSGKIKISGKITGSILSTDMGTLSGGKRIYTKN
jgi:hypothetical protein